MIFFPNFMKSCLLFLLLAGLSTSAIAQMKTIVCKPSGETVLVPKKPERAYRAYTKTIKANIKGTVDVLETLKLADLDIGVSNEVTQLRQQLDQYSSRTEDIIKASFLAYCMTPCDQNVRKRHFDLLEAINKENTALEKLKIETQKVLSSGNAAGIDDAQVRSIIKEYKQNNAEAAFAK